VVLESLQLKKGDSVTVETWNNGLSLAQRFVVEAKKVGAHPILLFEDEDIYVEGVKNTPADSLGKMGRHEYQLLSASDAYFFIPSEVLEPYTKKLSSDEVDQATDYGSSWYEAAEKAKLRGARMSFGFAGPQQARMLNKKLEDIIVHQLKASLVDFRSLQSTGKTIGEGMSKNSKGSITSAGGSRLDFEFESDNGARIEDGIVDEEDVSSGYNMAYLPPGIVSKGVKSDSVNGKVKLSPTFTWKGVINDAVLEFEGGRLVKWSSISSKARLDSLIKDQSENERKIDQITVGLNPLMRYGYAQDRFVEGSIGIGGLEFTGIIRNGTLQTDQTILVEKGKVST